MRLRLDVADLAEPQGATGRPAAAERLTPLPPGHRRRRVGRPPRSSEDVGLLLPLPPGDHLQEATIAHDDQVRRRCTVYLTPQDRAHAEPHERRADDPLVRSEPGPERLI